MGAGAGGMAKNHQAIGAIMFEFPQNFDPAKQRAVSQNGKTFIQTIAPEVLAIPMIEPNEEGDPFADRSARANQLAAKGHVIDAQVDVWGWGAVKTMRLRRMYGKTEVPDAFGTCSILVPPEAE